VSQFRRQRLLQKPFQLLLQFQKPLLFQFLFQKPESLSTMSRKLKSAIAVITYNRLAALQEMALGLGTHCRDYRTAFFEDCGTDGTKAWFGSGETEVRKPVEREDLLARRYQLRPNLEAFVGMANLGVAGNSNRAIKWFMDETDCDHLLLCNDDLHVLGDFAAFYAQAHLDLGIGFFCFNDFWESPTHRWVIARSRGYRVKVFHRMTGIMMSVLRDGVNKIGYFDTRFGRFGEEHCDWTNRMRFAGLIKLDGLDQMNLDVEPTLPNGDAGPPVLKHQDVPTSITGEERRKEDTTASERMKEASQRYLHEPHYRPFTLITHQVTGGTPTVGISLSEMQGYKTVQCPP
jgi:hypothetical protein